MSSMSWKIPNLTPRRVYEDRTGSTHARVPFYFRRHAVHWKERTHGCMMMTSEVLSKVKGLSGRLSCDSRLIDTAGTSL